MLLSIILLLSLLVIILLVIGLVFIFKGYSSIPESSQVVSKEDFNRTEKELQESNKKEEELKIKLDSMAIDLENTKKEVEDGKKQEEIYQSINKEVVDYKSKLELLERDLNFITNKADHQAKDAIEVIKVLNGKNDVLREEMIKNSSKVSEDTLKILQDEKEALENQLEQNIIKISQLEDSVSQENGLLESKLEKMQQQVEDLEHEKQLLKEGLEQINTKIREVKAVFGAIPLNQNLIKQGSEHRIKELQSELEVLIEQIQANEQNVQALTKKLEVSQVDQYQAQTIIGSLQEENIQLKEEMKKARVEDEEEQELLLQQKGWFQEKYDLEQSLKTLKTDNVFLKQKERRLQWELRKSRIQALGFEKICQEYKNQFENQ